MASKITIKKSAVAGKIPSLSDLSPGELGINTRDNILYSANTTDVFAIGSVANTINILHGIYANNSLGTAGQVLSANSTGGLYWSTPAGGGVDTFGTPVDNQIAVFTDADTIEGDSNFTWDSGAQLLTVTGRRYTATSNAVNKPAASTDFYRDQYEWSLSQGSPNLTSSPNFYQQYIKGTIGLTNAGSGSNALNYSNIYNTVTFNSAGSGSTARINNIYSLYNYLTLSAQAGEIVDSARTVYNRLYISDDVKGDNNGTFDAFVVENRVDTLNNSLGKIGNLIGEKVFFNITNSGSSITTAKSYEARFSSSATIANGYLFDGYYVGTLPTNAYGFRFYNGSNPGNGDLTSIHDGDIEPYTTLAGNLGSATTYWGGIYVDNAFISGEVSANGSVGTAGQVLTSGGTGANAYWSTVSGGSSLSAANGIFIQSNGINVKPANSTIFVTASGVSANVDAIGASLAYDIRVYQSNTASTGQTTFTITGGYDVNKINVFVNGVKLSDDEFTQNGSTVVLDTGLANNDVIDVVGYKRLATTNFDGYVRRIYQSNTSIGAQTTFTIEGGYTVGSVDVFLNGIHLDPSEYTENGTTIVLDVAAANNDIFEISGYDLAGVSGVGLVPASGADNRVAVFANSTAIEGDANLTWDGTKFAIGTTNPDNKLHVAGSISLDAYLSGTPGKGIFFRDGFNESTSPFNLAILTHDFNGEASGNTSPDALMLTGFDGVAIHTGSNTYDADNIRILAQQDGDVNILGNTKIGGAAGDTPSAKLHVTNAGTGDSFRVDDAASDTTPFVINSSGYIIKGYTSSLGTYDHPQSETDSTPQFQIHGAVSPSAGLALTSWNTLDSSYYAPVIYLAKSSSGTVGTQASGLVDGEDLGSIVWSGDDGVSFIKAAMIQAEIDGTPGVDDIPGRIKFLTSADGSATPTERMRITSDGKVGIGSTPTYNFEVKTLNDPQVSYFGDSSDAVVLHHDSANSIITFGNYGGAGATADFIYDRASGKFYLTKGTGGVPSGTILDIFLTAEVISTGTSSGIFRSDRFDSYQYNLNSFLDFDQDSAAPQRAAAGTGTNSTQLSSIGALTITLDTNNNDTFPFTIAHNNSTPASATSLWQLSPADHSVTQYPNTNTRWSSTYVIYGLSTGASMITLGPEGTGDNKISVNQAEGINMFVAKIAGIRTDNAAGIAFELRGAIQYTTSGTATAIVGTVSKDTITSFGTVTSIDVQAIADDTNETLLIQAQSGGSYNMNWTATVELIHVGTT